MRATKESIERYQALLKEREDHKKELAELRNKVIEECLWYLGCNSVIPLDESQRQILNSLKK